MQRCKFGNGSLGDFGCRNRQSFITGSPQDFRSKIDVNAACRYGLTAASFAEISAVCAVVPQLGASLPSPHARGR
ncbi:MAG: hypothetical protein JWP84_5219 [Tardiphaga sp.]|nr:hypothetical protein [Tardiphaga sp.]